MSLMELVKFFCMHRSEKTCDSLARARINPKVSKDDRLTWINFCTVSLEPRQPQSHRFIMTECVVDS